METSIHYIAPRLALVIILLTYIIKFLIYYYNLKLRLSQLKNEHSRLMDENGKYSLFALIKKDKLFRKDIFT